LGANENQAHADDHHAQTEDGVRRPGNDHADDCQRKAGDRQDTDRRHRLSSSLVGLALLHGVGESLRTAPEARGKGDETPHAGGQAQ
jgi:hypothetical protein